MGHVALNPASHEERPRQARHADQPRVRAAGLPHAPSQRGVQPAGAVRARLARGRRGRRRYGDGPREPPAREAGGRPRPELLQTVRGAGYVLRARPSAARPRLGYKPGHGNAVDGGRAMKESECPPEYKNPRNPYPQEPRQAGQALPLVRPSHVVQGVQGSADFGWWRCDVAGASTARLRPRACASAARSARSPTTTWTLTLSSPTAGMTRGLTTSGLAYGPKPAAPRCCSSALGWRGRR